MFGTSPVNQETAEKLIPQLDEVNGFKFLSVEPQLDDIDFTVKMKNSKNWTVPIEKEYFNKLHENSLKNLISCVKSTQLSDKKLIVISHFPPLRKTKIQENLTAGFPTHFPNQNKELREERHKKLELIMATGTDLLMTNCII
jgi:hypothetical protein